MYKYLYGRWDILKGLVDGSQNIRLCDIRHYARLENTHMRDNEEYKKFSFQPDELLVNVAGVALRPEAIARDIEVEIKVRNALCICFSNKKNDLELFDKFKADVCIEFNVDYLVDFLNFVFSEKLNGQVVSKNVTYYSTNAGVSSLSSHEAVFMKSESYIHEDEFRVAVFLPYDDESVISYDEKRIHTFKKCECSLDTILSKKCECYFAYLHNGLKDGFKSYVGEIYHLERTVC